MSFTVFNRQQWSGLNPISPLNSIWILQKTREIKISKLVKDLFSINDSRLSFAPIVSNISYEIRKRSDGNFEITIKENLTSCILGIGFGYSF